MIVQVLPKQGVANLFFLPHSLPLKNVSPLRVEVYFASLPTARLGFNLLQMRSCRHMVCFASLGIFHFWQMVCLVTGRLVFRVSHSLSCRTATSFSPFLLLPWKHCILGRGFSSFCISPRLDTVRTLRGLPVRGNSENRLKTVYLTPSRRGLTEETNARAVEFNQEIFEETERVTPSIPSEVVVQICDILDAKAWGPETVEALEKSGVAFVSSIVSKVLDRTKFVEPALGFFNWLQSKGFKHDTRSYTVMICLLGKAGHLDKLEQLVAGMHKPGPFKDTDLYRNVIHWYARLGNVTGALKFWEDMKQEGIVPSPSLYGTMIDLFATEKQNEQAVKCFWQMVENGPFPSSKVYAILIYHLLDAGKLDAAYLIFSKLSEIKVVPLMQSFAYLMFAYANVDKMDIVKKLGGELREYFDRPGNIFCMAVIFLQRKGKFKEAEMFAEEVWPELSERERAERVSKIYDQLEGQTPEAQDSTSFKEEIAVGNLKYRDRFRGDSHTTLMREVRALRYWDTLTASNFEQVNWNDDLVYMTLRLINEAYLAWQFFRWLESRPGFKHEIYNRITMLRRLAQSNLFQALRELLKEMQREGIKLCITTFNSIIRDCGVAKNWRAAFWIFKRIKVSNLKPNRKTFTVMIHMLALGKHHMQACRWWRLMQRSGFQLDTETSTVLIHSLVSAGKIYTAQLVCEQMLKAGCSPDVYSYMALIQTHNNTGMAVREAPAVPLSETVSFVGNALQQVGKSIDAKKLAEATALSSKTSKEILTFIHKVLAENFLEKERATSFVFTKAWMEL